MMKFKIFMICVIVLSYSCRTKNEVEKETEITTEFFSYDDPFEGDEYDFEKVLEEISGEWRLIDGGNSRLHVMKNHYRFSFNSEGRGKEVLNLNEIEHRFDETLDFEFQGSLYSVYWVWEDPNNLLLTIPADNGAEKLKFQFIKD